MKQRMLNPFLYGKPVPPRQFVGREGVMRTLFSRIGNGESTAVVGGPHIGKSSVLRYVTDPTVQREWLGERAERLIFVELDCHMMPSQFNPTEFWNFVLSSIEAAEPEEAAASQSQALRHDSASSFALQAYFASLSRRDIAAVLAVDEFDALLNHPNFNTPDFFGSLRSLATRTDGLMLITASRLSVAEMNRRSQMGNLLGSPFFNNFTEIELPPLSKTEVNLLLDRVLDGTGQALSPEARRFIERVAGRHPFLVQTAAASLFDEILAGVEGEERYYQAYRTLYQRTAAHFDDLWQHLEAEEQTAMLTLALAELRGHLDGAEFSVEEMGRREWHEPRLRRLEEKGLVEHERLSARGGQPWESSWRHSAIWQEDRWRVSSACFLWWVYDNVVSGAKDTVQFSHWLQNRTEEGVITNQGRETLQSLTSSIPAKIDARTAFQGFMAINRGYQNFDLQLSKTADGAMRVAVIQSPAGEASAIVPLPAYGISDLEQTTPDAFLALAQQVGERLLPTEVRLRFEEAFRLASSQGDGLTLRLRIEDDDIASVPWEAARIGDNYLSLRPTSPIVRYVSAPEPQRALKTPEPLRILVLISNPTDLAPIDSSTERQSLEHALHELAERGRVQVTWLSQPTMQSFQDALRQQPHVVHFIGHGAYLDGNGTLAFVAEPGTAQLVSSDWLATLLTDSSVRLIFLNACESGRTVNGLAQVLVRRCIPVAIGMQAAVIDAVAIAFAAAFYRALSDGWAVNAALTEGRKAIVNALEGNPERPDWVYPVLYARSVDSSLFA